MIRKYDIGDLIVDDSTKHEKKQTGLIVSLNEDDMWEGGGYYEIMWSDVFNDGRRRSGTLSYLYLSTLEQKHIYKIYKVV